MSNRIIQLHDNFLLPDDRRTIAYPKSSHVALTTSREHFLAAARTSPLHYTAAILRDPFSLKPEKYSELINSFYKATDMKLNNQALFAGGEKIGDREFDFSPTRGLPDELQELSYIMASLLVQTKSMGRYVIGARKNFAFEGEHFHLGTGITATINTTFGMHGTRWKADDGEWRHVKEGHIIYISDFFLHGNPIIPNRKNQDRYTVIATNTLD